MSDCLLFAGPSYYAAGGWNDFIGSFDSVDAAVSRGLELIADPEPLPRRATSAELAAYQAQDFHEWFHVVSGGEIVARGGMPYGAESDLPNLAENP